MRKIFTKAVLGAVLGTTVLAAATPAQAQWRGYRRGPGPGAVVAAGVAGVAIGAAIASRPRYFGPGPRFVGPGPWAGPGFYGPGPGFYGPGPWAGPGFYRPYPVCFVRQRWDPYWGGFVPVRICR